MDGRHRTAPRIRRLRRESIWADQQTVKAGMALPKGLVDPGEKPLETALREVHEETGVTADLVTKLGDIKYVYARTWAEASAFSRLSAST